MKFWKQCVNVTEPTWGHIYFLMSKNFSWEFRTQCAMTLSATFCACCVNMMLTNYKQIKLGWALFVTYTIIQSIMRSEMCSLHLTHPSVHTWSRGQPTVQRPGSSRGLPVRAGIRTHNLGLPRVSSPTLYPLGLMLTVVLDEIWTYTHLICTKTDSAFLKMNKDS